MKKLSLKFILSGTIVLTIIGCQSQKSEYKKMLAFGKDYTAAWNSKDPDKMASFYAEDGSLTVNNGTPAVGRKQLAETAKSYMEAFPDMVLTMDSLMADGNTYRYHWQFIGTNTGPGGTGNKVDFVGLEQWTLNTEGLVQKSIGSYDTDDYNRQLNQN
jgi:ketosteroid isomerase-like protein